jgi:hypothetical protein
MEIIKNIAIKNIRSNLTEQIISYMIIQGYRHVVKEKTLTFKRGFANFLSITWSPKDNRCRVNIKILSENSEAILRYNLDTKYQIVLPWEKAYWMAEVDNIEAVIKGNQPETLYSEKALKKAIRLNYAFTPIAIIIVVAVGVIVWLLPMLGIGKLIEFVFNKSESDSLFIAVFTWIALLIGILAFLTRRKTKRRKKSFRNPYLL